MKKNDNITTRIKSIGLKRASVITVTNRLNYLDRIFENYFRQNYIEKELIIILNNNCLNLTLYQEKAAQYENIKVFQLDEKNTLGECKNFAFENTAYEYIAFFDDDDYYGPNYLNRSIDIFHKIQCDIVGKKAFFIYFEKNRTLALCLQQRENQYVGHAADSSLIVKRNVLEKIKFPSLKGSGTVSSFQKACIESGYRIYSTDRFNYVAHRHPDPNAQHTWKIEESNLLKNCNIIRESIINYIPYVIR